MKRGEGMQTVKALRQIRQGFCPKVSKEDFKELFRQMSPVRTPYWCCPGSPPQLPYRTDFDNAEYCFQKRASREIIKGRFQGGGLAYILAEELPLFASLYQLKGELTLREEEMLDLLRREGPMSVRMLKEASGLSTRETTAALHRLQRKFLVFEDQADNEWDRSWYCMEEVFPDLEKGKIPFEDALETIIRRFARLNVVITVENLVSFYQLPTRKIQPVFQKLAEQGVLVPYREGFSLAEDLPVLEKHELVPSPGIVALNRNDFLVKSNEHWLKESYQYPGWEVLQYLVIDGMFKGVAVGKFHNGPFEIEDILLHIPPDDWEKRKEEILAALAVENPSVCPKRYCGQRL